MCPILPCTRPTAPGVYWRDTSSFRLFDAARSTQIKAAVAAMQSNPGTSAQLVDLGSIVSAVHPHPGHRYRFDPARMQQISAHGMVREVLLIEDAAPASAGASPQGMTTPSSTEGDFEDLELHVLRSDGEYTIVDRNVGRTALQRVVAILGNQQASGPVVAACSAPTSARDDNGDKWKVTCLGGQLYVKLLPESCHNCMMLHLPCTGHSAVGSSVADTLPPRGVWCKARIVLSAPKAVIRRRRPIMTVFERQCMAAMEIVKRTYLNLVAAQLSQHDPMLNPALWDLKVSLVGEFIKNLVEVNSSSGGDLIAGRDFAFGFHGTQSPNRNSIMEHGFDKSKDKCSRGGAFFSGNFDFAKNHARRDGRGFSNEVFVVALLAGQSYIDGHTGCLCDNHGRILQQELIVPWKSTLPLASIPCH